MIKTRLTRQTAFRLAGMVAAIISLTNLVIFFVLFLIISRQLNENLKSHVNEVRKTLEDIEQSGGFDELAAMVSRRASVAQSDEDIYLLTDTNNKYVSGNIKEIEPFGGWRMIKWSDLPLIGVWTGPRASTAVIGTWTKLDKGNLFVGDGNGDINDAQRLLLNGLIWAIGLSIICALAGGYVIGLNAQRRVSAMESALNAVATGQLQRRVPRNAASDDIDHVAALINATLDRLQSLIANLKQVSTDIAHDLRTPISRMRQKLEVVQAGSADTVAYKAAVDDALEEIDNIAETFEALLRISEIEGGARKLKFVDVELKTLLANIVDALEAVAEERGQSIVAELGASRPAIVRGDARLLNQLFINLIENSILHCPPGSGIRVELADDEHPAVKVRDNGPGIPADERSKVFRRLYRLEKSRSTRGSGLGLSLVAAIADLHGATITLSDNAPGLATQVVFHPGQKQDA